jgi:hypothetical protein
MVCHSTDTFFCQEDFICSWFKNTWQPIEKMETFFWQTPFLFWSLLNVTQVLPKKGDLKHDLMVLLC